MTDRIIDRIGQLGLEVSERKAEQFLLFYEQLTEWNKVMNLTGITEFDEVIEKHFVDSLSIVQAVDLKNVKTVIDIGTGAGFPGIPLKIMFPDLNMVLIDSLNKRIKYLNNVIEICQLSEINTFHGRAEEFARNPEYREAFDLCVSRAVANLSTLSEYCLPFVKAGGMFIPYKSGEIEEELNASDRAVHLLGGKIHDVIKFSLPGTDIKRSFVLIDKIGNTPKKYPRKAGTPAKEPL